MGTLQERIAAYADASANLLIQLIELDKLREQVRKAELSARRSADKSKENNLQQ